MLIEQYPNSQHMPYPDLFVFCLLNTTVGSSRVKTPSFFIKQPMQQSILKREKLIDCLKYFPSKY